MFFFARDIHKQFTYVNKKPYEDGFISGLNTLSKQIDIMVDTLNELKSRYPNKVNSDFIIRAIQNISLTNKK